MSTQSLSRLAGAIDSLNEWTGRSIAWLTVIMVLVQFAIVVLRYAFNTGWIAVQESILFMHALVFLLGAAFTLKRDAHVRVDIFYSKMSARGKAMVDLLGTLVLLLPVCLFIFTMSWGYVADSWRLLEGSREAGGLPGVFLLKSTILLMAGLLVLQGIAMLARSLVTLLGTEPDGEGA
ncbi:MAG: TRAP transporter small permease subunit [Granulosicoccaceae bacterium]|jgi:TRAP-type mannitol/chloroaromatic compound transport system permease small subunit